MNNKKYNNSILLLRTVHGLFSAYFIFCVLYINYSAITVHISLLLGIALFSVLLEGFLVYVLNHGNCPLAPLQWKLGDTTPFFNVFLPKHIAKQVIPFFTILTFIGIILLLTRYVLKI